MCGIAATWGTTDSQLVQSALAKLTHRGPDDHHIHLHDQKPSVLGHNRLAIIDPAGGRQPMLDAGRSKALVANGMIYNYRELRQRQTAVHFNTSSDSESILHTVTADNPAAVAELDGMFAFVMVDGDELIAARDPVGIKPLYVGRLNDTGTLCFASEIKALAGITDAIEEFPPGHTYHSTHGFQAYYQLPTQAPIARPLNADIERLRDTLETAVVKRLRSDVPLGAFLSGGLDSSIIAALARRHVDQLHTFSIGVAGSRDLLAARTVAKHLDTVHHEYIIKPEEILKALPQILFHLESFDQDLVRSAIPCYFVSRLAADYVKVVLTGEGADELFAGYHYYQAYSSSAAPLHQELRRSLASMHNINLQRVDRMTMAHSLEARVPFLDVAMIETAMAIEPGVKLYREGNTVTEKWILRKAFEDMLPDDIVWRVKEQFDEGSGIAALMAELASSDAVTALTSEPIQPQDGESAEQALYRTLLAQQFDEPAPVLNLVAHWAQRPAS